MSVSTRKIALQRRPEELPEPSRPPHAEVNKLQKVLSVRVSPQIKSQFKAYARGNGLTQRVVMEAALLAYFDKNQPKVQR